MNDTIAATFDEFAIRRAGVVRTVVDAIIAFFAVHGIDDCIAAARCEVAASKAAAIVVAVVDAIIANFTEPVLNDAVTANGLFAFGCAVVVVRFVAIVAFFASIKNPVATANQLAVCIAVGLCSAVLVTIVAGFGSLNLFIAAAVIFKLTVFCAAFTAVALFASFDLVVAAVRNDLAIHAAGAFGFIIVDMVFDIAFFIAADKAIAADSIAGTRALIEESGQC